MRALSLTEAVQMPTRDDMGMEGFRTVTGMTITGKDRVELVKKLMELLRA